MKTLAGAPLVAEGGEREKGKMEAPQTVRRLTENVRTCSRGPGKKWTQKGGALRSLTAQIVKNPLRRRKGKTPLTALRHAKNCRGKRVMTPGRSRREREGKKEREGEERFVSLFRGKRKKGPPLTSSWENATK